MMADQPQKKTVRLTGRAKLVPRLRKAFKEVEHFLPPQMSQADLGQVTDIVLNYFVKAGDAFKQDELDKRVEAWTEERRARIPAVKPEYLPPTSRVAAVFPKDGLFSYKNQLEIFNLIGPGLEAQEIGGDGGKDIVRYSKGKWILDFDRELLDREIRSDGSRRIPTLDQLEWRTWIAELDLAREMPSNTGADEIWVAFSDSDIIRRLGRDPQEVGGKGFKDIRRAIWNVAAARPGMHCEDGEAIHYIGAPFYTYFDYAIDKKTGRVFYLGRINPDAGEITLRHIRGQLQREGGQTKIEWIEYPREFLESSPTKAKARIRDHILKLPDDRWTYPIGYYTIAKDWAGFPQRELGRPKELKAKLETIFNELVEEGILEGWRPGIKGLKMWDKSTGKQFWRVKFKRRRLINADSERAAQLVSELMNWHLQPEFKIRKSPEELRDMLTATVNAYGVEACRDWQEEALNLGYNPQWFWFKVTCEKLDRRRGKSSKQDSSSESPGEPESKLEIGTEEPQQDAEPPGEKPKSEPRSMPFEELQEKARGFIRELEGRSGEDTTG